MKMGIERLAEARISQPEAQLIDPGKIVAKMLYGTSICKKNSKSCLG